MRSMLLQQVSPKAGTPGPAQEVAPSSGQTQAPPQSGGMMMFLPLLIMLPFLFLMFRRQKKETEARSKLQKGDRVVCNGFVGELAEMDTRFAKIKLAPGITVQVLSQTVAPLEDGAKKTDALADLKEAKSGAEKK